MSTDHQEPDQPASAEELIVAQEAHASHGLAPKPEVQIFDLAPVLKPSPMAMKNGHKLYVGYQLNDALSVVTEMGVIVYDKLTHAQAIWLIENRPDFARKHIIRGYYPKESPYWQGVDPETGAYNQQS